jgi:parallel beta-helix repeat protein
MRPIATLALALALLTGCPDPKDPIDTDGLPDDTGTPVDADLDGYSADEDCDDGDPGVHPGADELCNERDDDCDGETDEDATDATTWYADTDGDGFGDAEVATQACHQPTGHVDDDTDCDDADAAINPDAEDVCNGVDDDCDGDMDEDHEQLDWYADADADGYGDPDVSVTACAQPTGYLEDASDCDDSDDAIHPEADELCNSIDDDCDDAIDEDATDMATWYADTDADGYGDLDTTTSACEQPSDHVADATDCDDSDDSINPGASEVCNGVDDDCDGIADDGLTYSTWYQDADGDGYGTSLTTTSACAQPTGFVADATDCDDSEAAVNPGASEACNEADDDCDGDIDEGVTTTFYADTDADGYGDPGSSDEACAPSSGWIADDTDCDDDDASAYPGADEICDGVDNDCDGLTDDDDAIASGEGSTWFTDSDGDSYGDPMLPTTTLCVQPTGTTTDDTDCDDSDAGVNPGADEICDGVDNDCDGLIDDDDAIAAGEGSIWYTDSDGDGYGDPDAPTATLCTQPSGTVTDDTDCDDSDAGVNPGADEICDGADNDCDGLIDADDSLAAGEGSNWYADSDGDGYGDPLLPTPTECTQPSGTVSDDSDCDDSDAAVNPGADEICDGIDNDCDGLIDDDDTIASGEGGNWYTDGDGDGYGDPLLPTPTLCVQPSGTVSDDSDCDDSDASINPGAAEVCEDGVDDDCSGVADDGCVTAEEHCGTITSDTTWASGSVHIVTCNLYIQGSSRPTLTIEDNVSVSVDAGYSILVGWSSYGSLEVTGSSSGVLFTSSESSPAVGDWNGLSIGTYDQGSELTGLTVEYGGGNGYGGIYMYNSAADMDSCTVRYNDHAGIYITGSDAPRITSTLIANNDGDGVHAENGSLSVSGGETFIDNEVTDNAGYPVRIPALYAEALDATSTYAGNDDEYLLLVADTVDSDGLWQALDTPWLVDGDVYIQGSSRPEIEIEDGAELYFEADARLYIGWSSYGSMTIEAPTTGVFMSSVDSSPAAGDWKGLWFGSYDQGSSLEGLWVEHAGGGGYGAIYAYNADIELLDSVITDSGNAGLYVSGAEPDISGCSFLDNDDDGVTLTSSSGLSRSGSPSFEGNTMTGNGGYPISLPANFLGELASDNVMSSNGSDYVEVLADTVDTDATWRDLQAPYQITDAVSVQGSTTPELEIEDGAELYFDAGADLKIGWSSYAQLDVQGGTTGVLMSSVDASPAPGDWEGLSIGSYASLCTIDGLTLEYGGDNGYGGLYLYATEVEVTDSVFQYNDDAGIYVRSSTLDLKDSMVLDNDGVGVELNTAGELSTSGTPSFTGNLIDGNGEYPVVLPAISVGQLDDTSSYTGNGSDLIQVLGDTVDDDATWQDLGLPFLMDSNVAVQGSSRPELTIEAGVELQFETNVALSAGASSYGALDVQGSALDPVVFTSAEASPAAGDWEGIQLGSYCTDADTSIQHATIEYGGDNGYGNVYVYACNADIDNSTVTDSSSWGIYVRSGTPTIGTISYSGNASGDLYY